MSDKNELGILRETNGFTKGYIKEDVDKYVNNLVEEINKLTEKTQTLENELEEANDKLRNAEENLASAKKVSSGGGSGGAHEAELEEEVKTLKNKLNSTTITLRKLEEALQSEKKARQSEKMLYEAERGSGSIVSTPSESSRPSEDNSAQIAELNRTISEKDELIKNKEVLVQSKDKEIAELKKKVEELDSDLKKAKEAPAVSESEFKSSFDIGNVFIEAQNTAKKITIEAQAAADKLSEEAKEKAEKIISDAEAAAQTKTKEADERSSRVLEEADRKAKEIVDNAEKSLEDVKNEVINKAGGLDKISEEIRTSFRADLDKLKENLKVIADAINKAEENFSKTVEDADRKIDDYSKTMFDKKSLDEYLASVPSAERAKPVHESRRNSTSGGDNWAMDDLEALTKQVEISSNSKAENRPKNQSSNAEKWKNDLAALAKAAEVEGV